MNQWRNGVGTVVKGEKLVRFKRNSKFRRAMIIHGLKGRDTQKNDKKKLACIRTQHNTDLRSLARVKKVKSEFRSQFVSLRLKLFARKRRPREKKMKNVNYCFFFFACDKLWKTQVGWRLGCGVDRRRADETDVCRVCLSSVLLSAQTKRKEVTVITSNSVRLLSHKDVNLLKRGSQ